MAITVTPKYKPFTYEELVKPLEGYWKKYDTHEAALSEIDTATATLDYIVNAEPEDSPLRTVYADFKNKLAEASTELSNGWNSTDRNLLRELKSTFAKSIEPIPIQYKKLQSLIEEQRKGQLNNPSLRYNKKATDLSVGELINNPNWNYLSYNGEAITKDVSEMLTPISQVLTGISSGRKVPGFTTILEQYGLTPADVESYLRDPENPNHRFKAVIDKAIDTALHNSGVYTWNDPQAFAEAYKFATQGVYSAIGKVGTQHSRNPVSTRNGQGDAALFSAMGKAIAEASRTPFADTEKHDKATKAQKYHQTVHFNKATGNYFSDGEVAAKAKLNKELDKAGLTEEELVEYKKYMDVLNKGVGEAPSDPGDAIGWTLYSIKNNRYKKQIDKQYPKFASIDNGTDLLNAEKEYKSEASKRQTFIGEYVDSNNLQGGLKGFNGEELLAYAGKQIEHELSQSKEMTSNYSVLLSDEDMKTEIKGLARDYNVLVAANDVGGTDGKVTDIMQSGGKGMYKVNPATGDAIYIKPKRATDVIAKMEKGEGNIIQNSKFGTLVQVGTSLYKFKGLYQTAGVDLATEARNIAINITPQDMRDYSADNNGFPLLKHDPRKLNEEAQVAIYQQLRAKNQLKDAKDPRLQYAYIQTVTKDSSGKTKPDIHKVVFMKNSGLIVNSASPTTETHDASSLEYWRKITNEVAMTTLFNNENPYTSPKRKDAGNFGEF